MTMRRMLMGASLAGALSGPAGAVTLYLCNNPGTTHFRARLQTTPCNFPNLSTSVTLPNPPSYTPAINAQAKRITAVQKQLTSTNRSLTAQLNQKNAQVLAAVETLDKRVLQDHVVQELTAKITAEVTQRYEDEFALLRQEIVELKAKVAQLSS